jgi:hypothetical protein
VAAPHPYPAYLLRVDLLALSDRLHMSGPAPANGWLLARGFRRTSRWGVYWHDLPPIKHLEDAEIVWTVVLTRRPYDREYVDAAAVLKNAPPMLRGE